MVSSSLEWSNKMLKVEWKTKLPYLKLVKVWGSRFYSKEDKQNSLQYAREKEIEKI